jgi:Flp pilus assembly pilin Flp
VKGEKMRRFNEFLKEEDGVGVVELILILVVLIGLVLIFKSQLTTLINSIFTTITERAGTV